MARVEKRRSEASTLCLTYHITHVSLPLRNKLGFGIERSEAYVTHFSSSETTCPLPHKLRGDIVNIQHFVPLTKSCTDLCGLPASWDSVMSEMKHIYKTPSIHTGNKFNTPHQTIATRPLPLSPCWKLPISPIDSLSQLIGFLASFGIRSHYNSLIHRS